MVEIVLKPLGCLWDELPCEVFGVRPACCAVMRQGSFESGSKPRALQTLRAVRLRLCTFAALRCSWPGLCSAAGFRSIARRLAELGAEGVDLLLQLDHAQFPAYHGRVEAGVVLAGVRGR